MPGLSYGLLGLLLTISMWTNLLLLVWFAYKHLDFLEHRLSGSKCITETKNLWTGGMVGRLMRLGMVFIVMSMPGFMYLKGHAKKNAYQNIPRPLRRWMWGIHIAVFTNLIVLAALAWLIEISERS